VKVEADGENLASFSPLPLPQRLKESPEHAITKTALKLIFKGNLPLRGQGTP